MQEIELKFQMPEQALAAVRKELKRLDANGSAPLPLKAAYFDTPDRQLGAAGAALRVRQEGDAWVQTLKAGGKHAMIRLEDNHPAQPPAPRKPMRADLSLHKHAEVRALLHKALSWDEAADPKGEHAGLVELYRTDILRTRAQLMVNAGTPHEGVVELALDIGHIHAGHLSVPVRELEIELVSGHPMAVIDAARDWVHRHGLWLDTQTKAHRGDRLARLATQATQAAQTAQTGTDQAATSATVQARPAKLKPDANLRQAWSAGLESCLEHITGNMSELATAPGRPELAAYQWRQALRRLRVFGRLWAGTALALPEQSLAGAAQLSDQIGHWRDIEVLHWLPDALTATGGPPLPLPAPDPNARAVPDLVSLARSEAASALCLDLIASLLAQAEPTPAERELEAPFKPWLQRRLRKWLKPCTADAQDFRALDDPQLHRLRKRGKRVRLAANLYAPLWPEARWRKHERSLKAALDALGAVQDEVVAETWYAAHARQDARALFGQGWLAGRRKGLRRKARKSLGRWLKVRTPW